MTPNEKSCINGNAYQQGAWTASSFHPSGVQLLFADGRVQFVRDEIESNVWRALASRNGGETIDGAN
jgi:prepilin-type processing-associated H-X9-DG protein